MAALRIAAAAALMFCSAVPAPAAEIAARVTTIPTTERDVTVRFFRAPGDAPRATVLMLHGGGGFDRRLADNERYARALAEAGMDTYMIYYYSSADETALARGRQIFYDRIGDWAQLVSDVAAYARRQPGANGHVGLTGFSNGGILSVESVAADPSIDAAAVYYGAMPPDARRSARPLAPMLILHGDADRVIPLRAGRELADAARQLGGEAELVVYPGAPHGFGTRESADAEDALMRTIAFFRRELQAE